MVGVDRTDVPILDPPPDATDDGVDGLAVVRAGLDAACAVDVHCLSDGELEDRLAKLQRALA